MVSIHGNAERKLFPGYCLERVIEILDRPVPTGNRTRHRPARVLVVGHQAEQVDRFRQRFNVVGSAPVRVNPLGEPTRTGEAGRIRNRGDCQLQPGLVQRVGRDLNDGRQQIAVCPVNVLEVKLKPGIPVQLALPDHGLVHDRLGIGVGRQHMKTLLVEHGKNGHHRYLVFAGPLEYRRIGSSGDQSVLIHLVPGGHQKIDLPRVRQKRANRIGPAGQIKERDRLRMQQTSRGARAEAEVFSWFSASNVFLESAGRRYAVALPSKCASISSSVFPLVSGRKKTMVMK